jgi:hypothetical protein
MDDSHDYTGFVAPEPADLAPLFPGYEIQGLIATGGMGAVYRAVQKSLDRTVALKILPTELSRDAAFCAGFEAEAKAMARLNHPNLIGVYDFGEVNGMLFIIMEFVPGQSIYHSADGIAIDPGEVIRLVTGICHGLAHAHENGIIHRDIKPSNILLDLNVQPKIGDFGLARPFERKIEEGEEIFGTPHYTAPEVVDSPHSVDYRADIFSVGVMLHELLTGKLPANDPRPASVIAHCDVRFDAIIRRATQPIPASRYSSAHEMAEELQAIARSASGPRAVAAGAPRPVTPRRTYVAKKKKSSSASSVILVLVVIGAAAAAYSHFSKPPSAPATTPVVAEPAAKAPPAVAPPAAVVVPDEEIAEPAPEEPAPAVEEAVPEMAADPVPEVETPAIPDMAAPKFDVAGMLTRARKIMRDRASPLLASHAAKLGDNVTGLERDLNRVLRKLNYTRNSIEQYLAEEVASWKTNNNRLPAVFSGPFSTVPDGYKTYNEHLEKQTALDDKLQSELDELGATYVLGLEKQLERLKADNDAGAVALVEAEIERIKDSPKYFPKLMSGTAADDRE